MKITYAITVHNEPEEIEKLLTHILQYKREQDDIVVLDDYSTEETTNVLDFFKEDITVHQHRFDKNFSEHFNFLLSKCKGDFIFHIASGMKGLSTKQYMAIPPLLLWRLYKKCLYTILKLGKNKKNAPSFTRQSPPKLFLPNLEMEIHHERLCSCIQGKRQSIHPFIKGF